MSRITRRSLLAGVGASSLLLPAAAEARRYLLLGSSGKPTTPIPQADFSNPNNSSLIVVLAF